MGDFEGPGHGALLFDLETACDDSQPSSVRKEAIRSVLPKYYLGALTILPTQGVEGTREIFDDQMERAVLISTNMEQIITSGSNGLGAEALKVKNFIDVFRETVQTVADESGAITADEVDRLISEGDPGDGLEDPTNSDLIRSVALRGPFTFFSLSNRCVETSYNTAVDCGGCAVTLKEFRGLQARWVLRRLTTVIEPWFSRRRIINRFVWVIEWVPVEFLKTITTRCCGDTPTTIVTQQTVLDRGLQNFWQCYR